MAVLEIISDDIVAVDSPFLIGYRGLVGHEFDRRCRIRQCCVHAKEEALFVLYVGLFDQDRHLVSRKEARDIDMGEIVHGARLVVHCEFVDKELVVLVCVECDLVKACRSGLESVYGCIHRDQGIVFQRQAGILEIDVGCLVEIFCNSIVGARLHVKIQMRRKGLLKGYHIYILFRYLSVEQRCGCVDAAHKCVKAAECLCPGVEVAGFDRSQCQAVGRLKVGCRVRHGQLILSHQPV